MSELFIGLLPILGVVVGALLQHLLARSKEREGQLAQFRQQAYADFLKGVAKVAHHRTAEMIAQITDAKARMAIYGSNAVLEKLAAFEESGAVLMDEKARRAFLAMTEQMRADSSADPSAVGDGVLERILFRGPFEAETDHP